VCCNISQPTIRLFPSTLFHWFEASDNGLLRPEKLTFLFQNPLTLAESDSCNQANSLGLEQVSIAQIISNRQAFAPCENLKKLGQLIPSSIV
jgi:hypothetical protein